MHPELGLFGLTFKSYSAMAVAAAAAGAALSWPALRRAGLSARRSAALLSAMCAAFLIGARLWNCAISPESYGRSLNWYSLRLAGLSLYGGIFGAMAALALLLRVWRVPAWRVLDALAVPSGAAFCIARVGCFLNGCCRGIATDSPLGVVFPAKRTSIPLGPFSGLSVQHAVHPTQLYELFGAVVGLPLACFLERRLHLRPGGRFLIYGCWLCAVRLAVLPLRDTHYADGVQTLFYPALYLVLIALGLLLLLRRGKAAEEAEGNE